jgi:3'(2'), 5'-bisphosphate nucleotidase
VYQDELRVAERLAREAGQAALRFYGVATAALKEGGSPVTAADHAANDVIEAGLRAAFPEDAILSEESRDSPERMGSARCWVVDPLDGTKEFLARNGEFSIMIGLAVEGRAVVGAVYLPDGDVLFSAAEGGGASVIRGGERRPLVCAAAATSLRLVGSRSHADRTTLRIQEELGIDDVEPCGSVGVKCSRIAEGGRDLYVHPVPYLKEWDTCAPEVVLREAGGTVTDCCGAPLAYNKAKPAQPHGILAGAPGVRERVLPVVRRAFLESMEAAVA